MGYWGRTVGVLIGTLVWERKASRYYQERGVILHLPWFSQEKKTRVQMGGSRKYTYHKDIIDNVNTLYLRVRCHIKSLLCHGSWHSPVWFLSSSTPVILFQHELGAFLILTRVVWVQLVHCRIKTERWLALIQSLCLLWEMLNKNSQQTCLRKQESLALNVLTDL